MKKTTIAWAVTAIVMSIALLPHEKKQKIPRVTCRQMHSLQQQVLHQSMDYGVMPGIVYWVISSN